MNILFFTFYKPVPTHGGVERVTDVISRSLSVIYGHRCFSLYEKDVEGSVNDAIEQSSALPKNDRLLFLIDYLKDNNIDVVIVQGRRDVLDIFRKASTKYNIKLYYVLHSDPGYEFETFTREILWYDLRRYKGIEFFHRLYLLLLFPIYKSRIRNGLIAGYRESYSLVDKFIMISNHAVKYFSELCGINNLAKVCVINNPLSYDNCCHVDEYSKKKKQVLVVSRMEEHQKKISLALKAWKIVQDNEVMKDWKIEFVGDGPDLYLYKKMAKRLKLKRITFHGACVPTEYYRQSSLFLMTSCSEAWGMTITEAQQQMCVPIAFDSYCAVRDIITNGVNGILVKYPSVSEMAVKIIDIAGNEELRKKMALEGLQSTQEFSISKIIAKWNNLIEQ